MSITAGAAYTGREIIDSTQYAIAQATTAMHDVSTAVSHGHEALPFYMEAEFWVGMSFVMLAAVNLALLAIASFARRHGWTGRHDK